MSVVNVESPGFKDLAGLASFFRHAFVEKVQEVCARLFFQGLLTNRFVNAPKNVDRVLFLQFVGAI